MAATSVGTAETHRKGELPLTAGLLVAGPLLTLAGTIVGLVATPDDAMTDIEQVRHGAWVGFQLLIGIGAVALAAGLAILAGEAVRSRTGSTVTQALAWLLAPLALVAMIVSGYAGPALAADSGTVSIADPDTLAVALNVIEGIGDATFLTMGVVVGITLMAIGAAIRNGHHVISRRSGTVALVLGATCAVVNLALFAGTASTDVWILGPLMLQLAAFWAVAAGITIARRG